MGLYGLEIQLSDPKRLTTREHMVRIFYIILVYYVALYVLDLEFNLWFFAHYFFSLSI